MLVFQAIIKEIEKSCEQESTPSCHGQRAPAGEKGYGRRRQNMAWELKCR